jgi:hypothetical protein
MSAIAIYHQSCPKYPISLGAGVRQEPLLLHAERLREQLSVTLLDAICDGLIPVQLPRTLPAVLGLGQRQVFVREPHYHRSLAYS